MRGKRIEICLFVQHVQNTRTNLGNRNQILCQALVFFLVFLNILRPVADGIFATIAKSFDIFFRNTE